VEYPTTRITNDKFLLSLFSFNSDVGVVVPKPFP
jgi:hypothetical protein